jgi:hypothetical protein
LPPVAVVPDRRDTSRGLVKNIANVGLAALVMASGMVAGPNEITLTGATRATAYASCTAINRDHHDGIACEKR